MVFGKVEDSQGGYPLHPNTVSLVFRVQPQSNVAAPQALKPLRGRARR